MSAEPGGRFRAILGFSLLLLCSSALVAQPVPSGTPVQDPAGAAADLATHVLITSVAARRTARKARPGTERR
jgi:hypothetical protein